MKRALRTITAALAAGASLALLAGTSAQAQGAGPRIAPGLAKKLADNPNQTVEIVIRFPNVALPKNANRGQTLKALKTQLGPKLSTINAILAPYGIRLAANLNSNLWLDNSVVVRVPARAVRSLSAVADIQYVFENFRVSIPKVQAQSTASGAQSGKWHLDKVGAPAAWQAGFRGQNIRVGSLDTGVDAGHPELAGKVSAFAEFNDLGERVANASPHDTANHGTHTAGLIAGKTVGVAPDARILAALVLPNGEGTFAQVIAGMQWLLDPDNNASTDDGADVVSLSLGLPGQYEEFIRPTQNLIAAGAIPVYAAGNFGPNPGTIASPGSIPEVITVGATTQGDAVANFSSRGPVQWGSPYNSTFTKPDLVAPGQDVTSAFPGGGYGSLSGSSQAAPIVAGAVASMLSAKSGVSLSAVKDALYGSARAISGGENASGRGLLNLPGALERLIGRSIEASQPAPQQPAPQQPAPQQPAPQQPAPQPAPQQPPAAEQPAPAQPAGNANVVRGFAQLPEATAAKVVQPGPRLETTTPVASVEFRIRNSAGQVLFTNTERTSPYCVAGNSGNNCNGLDLSRLQPGQYRVEATVVTRDNRRQEYAEGLRITGPGSNNGNQGNANRGNGNQGNGNQGNGQGNQAAKRYQLEASNLLNGATQLRDPAPFDPTNGISAFLPETNSGARYRLPDDFARGRYTLSIRARGDQFNGAPVVSVRVGGREVGRAELKSNRYETTRVAAVTLAPGDVVDIIYLNDQYGGQGRDRNAIIDALILEPAS